MSIDYMTVSVMENKKYLILYFAHQKFQMKKERTSEEHLNLCKKRETSTINTMTIIRTWSQQRKSSVTAS